MELEPMIREKANLTKEREPSATKTVREKRIDLKDLFMIFLGFGCRAFGGPMVQLDMLRTEFVEKRAWLTPRKFSRVLALYQILPGPEATEMCVYMGYFGAGRLGGLVAGIGFILPGFVMMLLLSMVYVNYPIFMWKVSQKSVVAVQAAVASMVIKSVVKISLGACNLSPLEYKSFWAPAWAWSLAFASALRTNLGVNFMVIFILSGIWLILLRTMKGYKRVFLLLLLGLDLAITFYYAISASNSSVAAMGFGVARDPKPENLLALGLVAGSVSFGGAYTALPCLREESVVLGNGWMNATTFIDGLALVSVLPTPLVMFGTFVGYVGGGFVGAIMLTIGIFTPAFIITLFFHDFFEMLFKFDKDVSTEPPSTSSATFTDAAKENQSPSKVPMITTFLDGVTVSVMGLIAFTGLEIVSDVLNGDHKTESTVIFLGILNVYMINKEITGKWWYTPVMVSFVAFAGQILNK